MGFWVLLIQSYLADPPAALHLLEASQGHYRQINRDWGNRLAPGTGGHCECDQQKVFLQQLHLPKKRFLLIHGKKFWKV